MEYQKLINQLNSTDQLYQNLLTIIHTSPDIIVLKDEAGRWVEANRRTLDIFGLDENVYKGKTELDLIEIYPEFKKVAYEYMSTDQEAWESRRQISNEETVYIDGKKHLFEVVKTPIFHENGDRKSIVVIGRDITEREKAKRSLAKNEEMFRLILDNATDLIMVVDVSGVIEYATPSFEEVLGLNPEKFLGYHLDSIIHPNDKEVVSQSFERVVTERKQVSLTIKVKGKTDWVWLEIKKEPVINEGEVVSVVTVARDITERKLMEERLKHMAYHDILTGAPNRRLFWDKLSEKITHAEQNSDTFALLALDFDRFKWVNDTLGHDVGDELLVQFVNRISECIGEMDTLARIGGDEFMVILVESKACEEIATTAKQIIEKLQRPWQIKGHTFITTSSIGIATFPECGTTPSLLIKRADEALYKAKQEGRNNFQFFNDNENTDVNMAKLSDLRKALENNEFFLVYQPKFDLTKMEVHSIEALIRWNHPTKGLISPSEFIGLAEENDLIIPITLWVLKEVSEQCVRWEAEGIKNIPISVNISPKHFEKATFEKDIVSVIKESKIDPKNIILEVSESIMIKDQEKAIDTIKRLKNLGLRVSIDDFGIGFSALSYLMNLPVDELKIDRSFLQELTDKGNLALVGAIVKLAHNLKLSVVAEGIESEIQHKVLNDIGFDIGQGFLFSKPLIGEQMKQIFLEKK